MKVLSQKPLGLQRMKDVLEPSLANETANTLPKFISKEKILSDETSFQVICLKSSNSLNLIQLNFGGKNLVSFPVAHYQIEGFPSSIYNH